MRKLTVLYDGECGFCRQCRDWMRRQNALVPMEFLALQSGEVDRRFPGIRRFSPERALVAIDERGGVYQGDRAWIVCLFALEDYRMLAKQLANPLLAPLARRACALVSRNRRWISHWLGEDCEGACHV